MHFHRSREKLHGPPLTLFLRHQDLVTAMAFLFRKTVVFGFGLAQELGSSAT